MFGIADTQCSSPESVPAFDPDTECSWSPALSPLADPFTPYREYDLTAPAQASVTDLKFTEDTFTSFRSSYSTLTGWAGDAFAKHDDLLSSESSFPFVVSQAPMAYNLDSMGVLKDPFDAATPSIYGGCSHNLGVGAFTTDQTLSRWDSLHDQQSFQYWSQSFAQDPHCRQDDLLLFSQSGIDTGGRLVQEV